MDLLNDIFDELELNSHKHIWNLTCDESIKEWKKRKKYLITKK